MFGGVDTVDSDHVFADIARELGIGSIVSQVQRVSGGYMHKMYCLETTAGKYAVKMLNPAIMKRPDAFDNYQMAERLERVLHDSGLPVVSALEFGGKKMQCLGDQYFYVFEWIDAKALDPQEITIEHCRLMGGILAKIHGIERLQEPFGMDDIHIDWDNYTDLAKERCPEIAGLLAANAEQLYRFQHEANLAFPKIPAVACICNGDMDIKNVLWVGGEPRIIDLECLDYGNPYMELFSLALSWSGYDRCCIDYQLLRAFIAAYCLENGDIQADWEVLYDSNCGCLEWLEYNTKRALMIECENDEERMLGIEQVAGTVDQVAYYRSIRFELLRELNRPFG